MDTISEAVPLDDITHWTPSGSCGRLQVLRLDLVHPVISGNKWYKLKYNVAEAVALDKKALLTFGGGHSNHLVATAYAAKQAGLRSVGIVRGNYAAGQITPTLLACEAYGMQLLPFTKAQYAMANFPDGLAQLARQFPDARIIPEGGANEAGIRGAADIAGFIPADATDVCVAVGTGTTLAGLQTALGRDVRLHGFCAARNCDAAVALLTRQSSDNPSVMHAVSDPRFGKWTDDLLRFIKEFHQSTGIPLDVVYTGKMMATLELMLAGGFFGRNRKIVCIHTGGLQGNPPGLFA